MLNPDLRSKALGDIEQPPSSKGLCRARGDGDGSLMSFGGVGVAGVVVVVVDLGVVVDDLGLE